MEGVAEMRNILEYPITKKEMLDAMDEAIKNAYDKIKLSRVIGDITPTALQEAREIIQMWKPE